jgi:hypothetical protein
LKTAWIVGIVMAYLLIFALEMWSTGAESLDIAGNAATASQTMLSALGGTPISGLLAMGVTFFSYIVAILQMLILYAPTVFAGDMIWVWWFVCFPVDVGMVLSIIAVMRGVSSG